MAGVVLRSLRGLGTLYKQRSAHLVSVVITLPQTVHLSGLMLQPYCSRLTHDCLGPENLLLGSRSTVYHQSDISRWPHLDMRLCMATLKGDNKAEEEASVTFCSRDICWQIKGVLVPSSLGHAAKRTDICGAFELRSSARAF